MFLEVKNLTVCYDTAMILNGVSLTVESGEVVSLIGPNGAGKTTILRAIAGLIKWEKDTLRGTRLGKITFEGSIIFDGKRIDNLSAAKIARTGLMLCPERGRPFREMTVIENLKAGGYLWKDKKEVERHLDMVYELFPVLKEREKQVAGTLSGGERTILAVGRALMYEPKLLCIDEPSAGLAPKIKEDLFERIKDVHGLGITMLIAEQDVSLAFDLANRNYVLSRGKVIADGTAEGLLQDDVIRETYLGL